MPIKSRAKTVTSRRRVTLASTSAKGVDYFSSHEERTTLEFISTGCVLLDNVIGGGYVLGRIANIVGDKSSGKTLCAIEACANFANSYSDGYIRYAEAEAAFDEKYAEALGMPVERVDFAEDIGTVEELFEDLEKTIDSLNGRPGLYIVDSLDALSDKAEQARKIDENSMGMSKQKKLSELFRKLVQKVEKARLCIIFISQIRDKIGVTFGETKTRTGGRSLDFYATQVFWLHEISKLKKTVEKIERIVGVQVKVKCKKNKIGLPFRECEYPIIFGYGIDDLTASVEWLVENYREHRLAELGLSKAGYKIRLSNIRNRGGEEAKELRKKLSVIINSEWKEIEQKFLPQAKKY